MKKIYFIALMLLICTGGFSQKVKINKNIISLDNVNVGIAEKYENKETREKGYTYSDLEGKNKFTLIRYDFGTGMPLMFALRPSFSKDTAEIKMEYLYFTMNEQNALTDLLVKRYHFFDKSGMNKDTINDYVSAAHDPQIPLLIQEKQAELIQKQTEEKQQQVARAMAISVKRNGEIFSGLDKRLGSFVPAPNPNKRIDPTNQIIVKDEAGNDIAAVTGYSVTGFTYKATVTTYDKNTFQFDFDYHNEYDKNNPTPFYEKIANFLAEKEYMTGQSNSYAIKKDEYEKVQQETAEANEADRKAKTDINGVLTLNDGTKLKGAFRFEYRQTPEGQIAPEGSISDLDAGKVIFYFYQDEKGKNKVKKFGVKDASTFYINDGEVYESVAYKRGNRLKESISGGSFDMGKMLGGNTTQKFLLRLAVTEKARLYFYGGEYILMKPGSEDAIVGKTLNTADLTKFTSDCPTVSQKVASNGYNNGGDSYKQLVEDYTKCN